jgi:hypothetical protein
VPSTEQVRARARGENNLTIRHRPFHVDTKRCRFGRAFELAGFVLCAVGGSATSCQRGLTLLRYTSGLMAPTCSDVATPQVDLNSELAPSFDVPLSQKVDLNSDLSRTSVDSRDAARVQTTLSSARNGAQ